MSLLKVLGFIVNHPLNREQKLRSIIRFVKWQIQSRLVPGVAIIDWINGSKFFAKKGEVGITGNIYTGLHEFSDMGFLLHFLRDGDLFVDVGANVGSYTILACSAVGANGIAFEPVPSTYRRLVDNIQLNHLEKKVKCLNKGVGSNQGVVDFTSEENATNHALSPSEECKNKVTVEITSLDSGLHGSDPSLIKIDVEGYESEVLEGAKKTLKNRKLNAVIMELNGSGDRYGFDESQLLNLMISNDFSPYTYDPFNRLLVNIEGKNTFSGNTLFIRNKAFVEERLKTAPPIAIHGRQL
ncbi:MAG: FkbM family methyltransferase [Gammaproteobacteria bacterium]|nr:FkbM family methyltransferase [Gammaproteobacteria bacterium]